MRLSRRIALLGPIAAALIAASPKKRRAAPPPPPPIGPVEFVALETELGRILLRIAVDKAPVTGTNFVRYVDGRKFDGTTFYRAMHLPWGDPPNCLIQAGTRGDPKRNLKPIAHEPTSQTGLTHRTGALSMARYAPGTATGDFSIMLSPQPGLDADPAATDPELKAGYAVFGEVIEGMEVVRAIFDAPISPTEGEGVMRGQMLAKPVKILTARRVFLMPPAP